MFLLTCGSRRIFAANLFYGKSFGGEAFGILGMLFSVPVCAVLYSLYLEFMQKSDARS